MTTQEKFNWFLVTSTNWRVVWSSHESSRASGFTRNGWIRISVWLFYFRLQFRLWSCLFQHAFKHSILFSSLFFRFLFLVAFSCLHSFRWLSFHSLCCQNLLFSFFFSFIFVVIALLCVCVFCVLWNALRWKSEKLNLLNAWNVWKLILWP